MHEILAFLAETNSIFYLLVHFKTMQGKTNSEKKPQAVSVSTPF